MIEVKSKSNTKRRLQEVVAICLGSGSLECWIVDQEQKSVLAIRRDGSRQVYGEDSEIPLTAFGGGSFAVREIFE